VLTILLGVSSGLDNQAYGHSGGTDSQGGHFATKTGEYHFHHGYGPHQHPNGVCPYLGYVGTVEKKKSFVKRIWQEYWILIVAGIFLLGYNLFKDDD